MSFVMSFTFNAVEICAALHSLFLIGLLQGSGCGMLTIMMMMIMMMMMMIISEMIKINIFSGMKNEGLKNS